MISVTDRAVDLAQVCTVLVYHLDHPVDDHLAFAVRESVCH
jgi:hypothetical protein